MVQSVTIRLQVLLVIVFLLGVAAQTQKKNPFLVQKEEREQHMQEMKLVHKLQQDQLGQPSPPNTGHSPQNKQVPAPPRSKPTQNWRPHATQSPFKRPQNQARPQRPQNQGREQRRRYNGGRKQNRNEMHRNGPGPTPWTRWTEKPRPRQSPWKNKNSKLEMAECNGRPYNARELICCQGSVRRRQGLRPACCGAEAFDFVFNLCCDGNVTPRTADRPFC